MTSEQLSDKRPWGRWIIIDQGLGYKVKRIEVEPNQRLSLQKHKHRSEHWTVVSGQAQVTCDNGAKRLKVNESIFIPQGAQHRVANVGPATLVFIEVQIGSYLGEDDIVRFEDDYGRS